MRLLRALNSMRATIPVFILILCLFPKVGFTQSQGGINLTPEQEAEWLATQREREAYEKKLWEELKDKPPKPPWVEFPDYDRYSMGWRMGGGEDHIFKLYVYFKKIDSEQLDKYKERYPEPKGWIGWYDE